MGDKDGVLLRFQGHDWEGTLRGWITSLAVEIVEVVRHRPGDKTQIQITEIYK